MKRMAVAAAIMISLVSASCKGTNPAAIPAAEPVISVSTLKIYPAGSMPTIRQDPNGYIISYYDYGNMWLMKTDAAGDCVWARSYMRGATYLDYVDMPYGVASCSDGYYITGDSHPTGGGTNQDYHDFIAIKTDLNGNEIWRKTIEDKGSFGADVVAAADGGIFTFITNTPSLQAMLIKYANDADGDTVWSKVLAMPEYEIPALLNDGTGFFLSYVDSAGANVEMLSSSGAGGGVMTYPLTGVFGEMGPSETQACAVSSAGFLTARTYKPAGGANNDIIVLISGSDGAVTGSQVFGRADDDEITAGIACNGEWALVPVNINSYPGGAYVMLLDSSGSFSREIAVAGIKRIDSITAGKTGNEFILVCSSDYIDMRIIRIIVE